MGATKDLAMCVDCGVRRIVRHKEWIRASQPRCRACGGRLEMSATAYDDHVAHNDALKDDRHKRDLKTNRA